jgi:hypothetical protein
MTDSTPNQEVLRRRLLGWGLSCPQMTPRTDLGRDLVLTVNADGTTDLAGVEKLDNLLQDLEVALTTLLGSDIFNTEFGFDGLQALTEGSSAMISRERVRIAVVQVLNKDPRVRRILDVKLDDGRLGPLQAGSRTLEVTVAFETVSAERATVELGGPAVA